MTARKIIPRGISFSEHFFSKKRFENSLLIGVPFAGFVACFPWFLIHQISWIELTAFIAFYIFGGLGICFGFHRYFSHRSFQAPVWLQYLMGIAGSTACQGSLIRWVSDHHRHHSNTDNPCDTHSPYFDGAGRPISGIKGFVYSHFGWMFDSSNTDINIYGRKLGENPVFVFFNKTHWLWPLLSLALPSFYGYLLGGGNHAVSCLLFAGCFRIAVFQHLTWSINSVCHLWGYQNYETGDFSKNNKALALLMFGESWHNNHHMSPNSAIHGHMPGELDIAGEVILFLERKGVIDQVVDARTKLKSQVAKRR